MRLPEQVPAAATTRDPRAVLPLVAGGGGARALLYAPRAVLGFDALFHVLWGRELAAGRLPVYDPLSADAAPAAAAAGRGAGPAG